MSLNLRVIVDAAGRTIVGEHEKETNDQLVLKNPATLFIQPNQATGQLAVQLIPFFFREFVGEANRATGLAWTFAKSSISYTDEFKIDPRLFDQYEKMMTKEANTDPPPVDEYEKIAGAAKMAPKEVKLFDEPDEQKVETK